MLKGKKALLGLTLVTALVVSMLTGCAPKAEAEKPAEPAAEKKLNIAVIVKGTEHPY